jgi:hypothetical protein
VLDEPRGGSGDWRVRGNNGNPEPEVTEIRDRRSIYVAFAGVDRSLSTFKATRPTGFLSSRRCAHRRTVHASGERDASLQYGAASCAVSPAPIRSHACWRQRRVNAPPTLASTVEVAA